MTRDRILDLIRKIPCLVISFLLMIALSAACDTGYLTQPDRTNELTHNLKEEIYITRISYLEIEIEIMQAEIKMKNIEIEILEINQRLCPSTY